MAYPAIIEATNAKAAADDSFAVIDNPDVIEVGQKLWIPAADAEAVGMANPASVYCGEQGGALDIRAADDGSQTGYCVFADGSECEEWAFMRGECSPASAATAEVTAAAEVEVTDIVLTGLLEDRKAEISGMDWYGDNLIMLPQYPTYFTDAEEGYAFALSKDDIMAFLDGAVASLAPTQISFIAPGVKDKAAGFQGYEAIAFVGDNDVYLTIEAEAEDGSMSGYLVHGTIASDLSTITVDTDNMTMIEPQAAIGNMAEETLIVVGDKLVTLYEANGAGVNASPVAHLFGMDMAAAGEVPLANIEYRLTDATKLDGDNRFWAINYFYPGDEDLTPASDPIVETYGEGETHSANDGVERLLQFQYADSGISLTDAAPIQLKLLEEDLRNWEGLVRLGDSGFLLMTDKYPGTILGFVPAAK
ncbi:MAG TPA: DUF333 domain-containing protein [Chloroflexi bacterium]|nr:DUF333 domain-containing protein [Chloroflexota bacterium]